MEKSFGRIAGRWSDRQQGRLGIHGRRGLLADQVRRNQMRIIVATLIVGGALLTMSIAAAQQPAGDPNFTGVVTTMDAKDVTAGRRNFAAGARTAWHSHDKGQLIYAESGRMRTGRRGQGYKEYDAGG